MWQVYILKSQLKKWYYVGSTNSLTKRFFEHENGKVRSTKGYRPLIIVFMKEFNLESEARKYEKILKDKRVEKEKIIQLIENKHYGIV